MIDDFLSILEFSLSVTGPIFVILMLGSVLRSAGIINDAFVEVGSKLVFLITLPALLFISISKTRISETTNFSLVIFGLANTLVIWLIASAVSRVAVREPRDRGVVVQGIFRSNLAIIGLAYCINAYGNPGLVAASLYVGCVTVLYNVLSVISLNASLHGKQTAASTLKGVLTNPLIIAVALAIPFSVSGVQLPKILLQSGEYFANMTLPLALLCTGASLSFRSETHDNKDVVMASMGKIVAMPLLSVIAALVLGFRGMELGIVLLLSAAPSAASGYAMVRAMKGNAVLAANIVAVTTVGSIFVTSFGIAALKALGYL